MLELGLHFSSAMNSVCGLRFSIPYLAGQLPCCSPLLLFPFQVRPTSRSDYRTGAIGLLGFYRFYRYRAFRPLDFYRLCYFLFQTYGFMSYFIFRTYTVIYISDVILYYGFTAWTLTFIFINRDFRNYYLSHHFYYYFESDGCHSFGIRAGFCPGSDPGWRFLETWFYSVLFGFRRF